MNRIKVDVVVSPFDYGLLISQPNVLRQLSEVYCNVWKFDPYFAEYRICPTCNRYFSEDQVVNQQISTCSNGHEPVALKEAWIPTEVASEILEQTQSVGFYGCLAAGLELTEIAGFAWVREMGASEVKSHWNEEFLDTLQSIAAPPFMYFDELATIPEVRGMGVGKALAANVCARMRDTKPNSLAFLRTHKDSAAVHIYNSFGFKTLGEDVSHGDGRIMMCVHPSSQITC